METPLDIPRYIQLSVKTELEHAVVGLWYRCVRDYAPSGVVTLMQASDDAGRPRGVQLVHRTRGTTHCYLVPIGRDLNAGEVDAIVLAFAEQTPDLDFDVETSAAILVANDPGAIPLDAAKHM